MGLIDHATVAGFWSHVRACVVLQVADVRVHRWRAKLAETGTLEDLPPGGNSVHRILDWEEQAILDLIELWGQVDRSHRTLAHRGSYIGKVFVASSTLLRVQLPGARPRPSRPKPVFPDVPWE